MDVEERPRAKYRPSGRVDRARFLPGFFAAVFAAVLMAWCLLLTYQRGFYLIFIAPIIAALPVCGLWYLVLRWSDCRNTAVATVASVSLALSLYFGYYHAGLVRNVGVQNAHRLDLWPGYVQFRMATDLAQEAAPPNHGNLRRAPDAFLPAFNWLCFAGELVAVVGLTVGVGRHCSLAAYCESCGRWMKSETLNLPVGKGGRVWTALRNRNHADVSWHLTETSARNQIGGLITVAYCPQCPADDRSDAVYLTIKDVPPPGTREPLSNRLGSLFGPRSTFHLTTLADQVRLHPEEIRTLASTFAGLGQAIEMRPDVFPEARSAAWRAARLRGESAGHWEKRVAVIEDVKPRNAGTVLTRRNAILRKAIGVGPAIGGLVMAVTPALMLSLLDSGPPDRALWVAVGWLFLGSFLTNAWLMFFTQFPIARFMEKRTRNAFEKRTDRAVNLDDPGLVFVDIIPRFNRGKRMMENASDIGFLGFDEARRELTFEGDHERYWIPAESILDVAHEFWAESTQHQQLAPPFLNHAVVVKAMTADGPWETWFYRRHHGLKPCTAKRRLADALELEARIRRFIGTARGDSVPAG